MDGGLSEAEGDATLSPASITGAPDQTRVKAVRQPLLRLTTHVGGVEARGGAAANITNVGFRRVSGNTLRITQSGADTIAIEQSWKNSYWHSIFRHNNTNVRNNLPN